MVIADRNWGRWLKGENFLKATAGKEVGRVAGRINVIKLLFSGNEVAINILLTGCFEPKK
jgi:hypothetical protein